MLIEVSQPKPEKNKMTQTSKPTCMQKIFFGPPGCGKSYRVRREAKDQLGIDKGSPNLIETTFHPEYGYGDFVAKLLPQTKTHSIAYTLEGISDQPLNGATITRTTAAPAIEYHVHAGPLIHALVRAYLVPDENVLLVIDEINRGNCAQIFGDIFQLLDRDTNGKSEYQIDMCDLTRTALEKQLGKLPTELEVKDKEDKVVAHKLRLPHNLSIIGTMNTSDESVYYMDTAFKRRWDFEYMDWNGGADTPDEQKNANIENTEYKWLEFLQKLNVFIADEFSGRRVDDKQVGIWFLKKMNRSTPIEMSPLAQSLSTLKRKPLLNDWKEHFPHATNYDKSKRYLDCVSIKGDLESIYGVDASHINLSVKPEELADHLLANIPIEFLSHSETIHEIPLESIRNKLMFFLWDNVFSRNVKPLVDLLKRENTTLEELRTFGEFASDINVRAFINGLMKDDSSVVEPELK